MKATTEKRLIDAKALWQYVKTTPISAATRVTIMCLLDTAPTVDAVEVVRCEDCKHCKKYRNRLDPMRKHQLCVRMDKYAFGVEEDDFCSYGERRTDDA